MLVFDGEHQAGRFVEGMLQRGIVVRPLRAFGLPNCVRVSTGTDEQNAWCLEGAEAVLTKRSDN
jgi:histidinol-phosphate aminotransferase